MNSEVSKPIISIDPDFSYCLKSSSASRKMSLQLTIKSGVTLLVGDNASGKTTLLKAIDPVVYQENFSGKVHYYNENDEEIDFRKQYGLLCNDVLAVYSTPEENHFSGSLTPGEIIRTFDEIGVSYDKEQLSLWLHEFQLELSLDMQIKKLSKGQQCMFFLFLALSRKPRILLLDEICCFLSIVNRPRVYKILKEYYCSDERSIIIASNNPLIEETHLIPDNVIVLIDLDVIESTTRVEINERFTGKMIEDAIVEIIEQGGLQNGTLDY